jgi:hypothetical protein
MSMRKYHDTKVNGKNKNNSYKTQDLYDISEQSSETNVAKKSKSLMNQVLSNKSLMSGLQDHRNVFRDTPESKKSRDILIDEGEKEYLENCRIFGMVDEHLEEIREIEEFFLQNKVHCVKYNYTLERKYSQ